MSKTFLDSVHGSIIIPKPICNAIVDTSYFQRLRRIEQNSCRAVFPSARHDRFIHSLGVYHLGRKISKHLTETCNCLPDDWHAIKDTYEMACLLHDLGHTPFSHTFEIFYDKKGMVEELRAMFNNDRFLNDSEIPLKNYTPHELLSAWLSVVVFKNQLDSLGIDQELMVRMIIGLPYKNEKGYPLRNEFRNVMIELIHGTIDADGLDYVCRDVWAGGYNNFNVNLHRLIESITVNLKDGIYTLSFSSKALNEIEAVLNVKNFQFLYVINHHKVLLEQHYLVEGVKSAAVYHCQIDNREQAIRALCDFHSFANENVLAKGYRLYRPCDDDFVCLMKQTIPEDEYITQWFSRKHTYKPLWKTRIEFFHLFRDILEEILSARPEGDSELVAVTESCEMLTKSLDEDCKEKITSLLGLEQNTILSIDINPKLRQFDPDKIKIDLNGIPIDYSKLKHEGFKVDAVNAPYHFWFLKSSYYDYYKERIFNAIKDYLRQRLGIKK